MNHIKYFIPDSIYTDFLFWLYSPVERATITNSTLIDVDNMFCQATVDCYLK